MLHLQSKTGIYRHLPHRKYCSDSISDPDRPRCGKYYKTFAKAVEKDTPRSLGAWLHQYFVVTILQSQEILADWRPYRHCGQGRL